MTKEATSWTLNAGDHIERSILQGTLGGRTQGGIGPSTRSPNVFLFSDPVAAARHGYVDGWDSEGVFHYTGEGQRGDQTLKSGNAAILRHKAEGRALRVFDGVRGMVRYVGEFELDNALPYYFADAPETGGGPVRQIVVFRLRPLDGKIGTPTVGETTPPRTNTEIVPIEEYNTEKAFVEPSRELWEAERRESKLVQQFKDYMRTRGVDVHRHKILPAGEAKPIFTDAYLPSENLLVEAKGTVERGAIRMAIGQLADYRRFFNNVECAILVPSRPRADLISLLETVGMFAIWADGKYFVRSHSDTNQSSPL